MAAHNQDPSTSSKEFWRKVGATLSHPLVAGTLAGMTEVLLLYPLDIIKTRQHLAGSSTFFDTLLAVVREEGFFGLYRGVLPAVIGVIPQHLTRVLCFEYIQSTLNSFNITSSSPTSPSTTTTAVAELPPNVRVNILAGMLAGIMETVACLPLDVIKVRMQTSRWIAQ